MNDLTRYLAVRDQIRAGDLIVFQGSDAISDTEQKEAVRNAQRRLEEAEQKLATVKRWVPVLEHAIAEYHATSQPLGDRLTGSLVNSLTLLDRVVGSLESYLATQAPSAPTFNPESLSGSDPSAVKSELGSAAQPLEEAEVAVVEPTPSRKGDLE